MIVTIQIKKNNLEGYALSRFFIWRRYVSMIVPDIKVLVTRLLNQLSRSVFPENGIKFPENDAKITFSNSIVASKRQWKFFCDSIMLPQMPRNAKTPSETFSRAHAKIHLNIIQFSKIAQVSKR